MISAINAPQEFDVAFSFSAIARSVMISALNFFWIRFMATGFSAIARSVMISAEQELLIERLDNVSVL